MSYPVKNTPYSYSLPPQKLATSKKGKSWREQSVDAIVNISSQTLQDNRSSKYNKQVNYNLYNSIFEERDFDYVLNPYGLKGNYKNVATKMKNYNIIRPKIELLKGEEMKRPFSFRVRAINGEVVSQRQDEKRKAILEHLQGIITPPAEGEEQPPMLEEIEKYFKTQYIHPREVTANQILEYGVRAEDLERKFNAGWEHALISSEEVYYVGIHNNEPKVRVVNPLNFDYDKTIELRSIEDAQWAKEERWMAIGEIIDEYGEYLSDDEVARLDRGEVGYPMNKMNYYPGFAYSMNELEGNTINTSPNGQNYNGNRTGSHAYVVNVVWKSLRKIGFVSFMDPRTGQLEETIVDETFDLTEEMKDAGATLRWQWIPEVWEGTRIGEDIYCNIHPLSNQFRDMNNPAECKLPYIGYVYNSVNAMSTSMVDLVKPHQYTYMIVWWRLEQELAKAKGKKFIMDMAKLPKSEGFTTEEWMYHFENTGVVWINSMEEGRKGDPNSISQFNQMTDVDMSLSQVVSQYLSVLQEIEDQVDRITGISRQRESNITSSETVGGVERAIQQSTHITEPWFYYHNTVKQKVLQAYIQNFRLTSNQNKKIHYITNDIHSSILEIDGTEFDDTNYNVFVSDSIKDNIIKQKLEGLAQIALQQEKMKFSDIVRLYKSESISELESKIVGAEQEFLQQQAESAQAEREAQAAQLQAQQDWEREKMQEESLQKQLDRENKLELAIISALGYAQDTDINTNGVPDVIEQGKLALESGREAFNQFVEENKVANEIRKTDADIRQKDKELKLKEKEMMLKEKQNIRDNKTKMKNPVAGENRKKK